MQQLWVSFHYYTSPEICLYKSNMLDWYVIQRDKMKNITYVYANERAGLITHEQFMWIKSLRYINYAVAHAQCLRQHVYAEDRHFFSPGETLSEDEIGRQEIKMLSIAKFVWQNNWYSMYVAIRYQNKIYISNEAF